MSDPEDLKDFFRDRVENPEDMGQGEKEQWCKIEPILSELLEELKAGNRIRTSPFNDEELNHISNLKDNIKQLSLNNDLLFRILADDKQMSKIFLKTVSKFGFDESRIVSLYIQQSIFYAITCFELFKTLVILRLRYVNCRESFDKIILTQAPKTWTKLKPFVDNKFRNSFAHGTWAIEGKEFVLFKNSKLEPHDEPLINKMGLR